MHHDIQKIISYHNFHLFFPICKRKEFKLFQLLESFKKNKKSLAKPSDKWKKTIPTFYCTISIWVAMSLKYEGLFAGTFFIRLLARSYALINIRNRIPVSICNSLQYIHPWIRSQSVHIYKWISLKVTNFFILWAVVELAEAIITEEKRILRNLKTKIINRVQLQS